MHCVQLLADILRTAARRAVNLKVGLLGGYAELGLREGRSQPLEEVLMES